MDKELASILRNFADKNNGEMGLYCYYIYNNFVARGYATNVHKKGFESPGYIYFSSQALALKAVEIAESYDKGLLRDGIQYNVQDNVKDNINPSHYKNGKIEVIDYIEDKQLNYNLGNAVKYISRAGRKHLDTYIEDLKKAIWYLEREIINEDGV